MNEREQFEAFASGAGKWPKAIERDSKGEYRLAQTASDWRVWQARAALAASPVPAGWRLVPVEPTPEMLQAFITAYNGAPTGSGVGYSFEDGLAAALAAAPVPTMLNGLTESAASVSAPAQQAEAPPSLRQQKLMELADRIDHEELWRRPGLECIDWPQDKRDRLDAGVNLRRYADLLQPGRWLVIPPTGPVQFSAKTLDAAYEMALKHEGRAATAPSVEAQADAIRRALESASDDLSERLSNIGGCTDGGCQVVPPKGMHTNGGCKCLSDHRTARRVVHAYQVFAKSVAALKESQR